MLNLILLLLLQDKKDAPKPPPKAIFAAPLSARPGAKTRLVVRGLSLDQASEAKVSGGATAQIKSKGKTPVPDNMEASDYGDTQVEIDLETPREAAGDLHLEIVTPQGTAPPLRIPVLEPLAEKEPNNGFQEAQPVEAGKTVQGSIGGRKDVDVFRLETAVGESWTIRVRAASLGSPLDPVLLLHDAGGRQLAFADDGASGRDPELRFTVSTPGPVYLTLLDAHDLGGSTHPYLLSVDRGP